MKLRSITYTEDETIETITVTMSLAEAAALHALAGKLNGYAHRKLKLSDDESLYECLADVFVKHYENGRPDGGPVLPDLAVLNDKDY